MFIKSLKIKETKPEEKLIREISFVTGLNFIVDAGIDQEKGNSVGKTTILKLIDICLGAKSKKYIYYDEETKQENTGLKDYITKNKLNVELIVCNSLENEDSDSHSLSVDLYRNGKRYIDGEVINQNKYWEELNKIFFSNTSNSPTFRQLINMFVRINQNADNNKFLKFLDRANDATYEHIYSYLFELNNQEISNDILKLKEELAEKKKEMTNFMSINNLQSIDSVHQKIVLLDSRIAELNSQMNILVDSNRFKENEEKITEIKMKYADYNNQIDELLFKKMRIENILIDAKKEQEQTIDTDVLKKLYDETTEAMGNLNKEFRELVHFNNELLQNKRRYFDEQLNKVERKINEFEDSKHVLFENHKSVIMLIEENKIDEYTEIQYQLAENNKELGSTKNIESTYNYLEDSRNDLIERLNNIDTDSDTDEDPILLFNKYFSRFSEQTNGEPFMIYKDDNGFPIGMDPVKRGLSTGTRKSIIAAFDLAYQQFSKERDKKTPNFIIHDVIETMDQVALSAIINIVNNIGCQYIVAVLKEKVESNNLISDDNFIVTLSENDRPFKM